MSENDPTLPDPDPGELLARAMQTDQPSGAAGGGRWTPPTPEELAELLPQYRIESLLGAGGMGAVYKGVQVALKRPVAIKLLPLEVSADPAFAKRFEHEAQTLAKLSHPNIVAVHDFGTTSEGHLYFVMEFVEGTDLHKMIHGPGLSPAQSLTIIIAVCEALQYAHGKGVVHRDIKPANVMVSTEGTVKVADFGLARLNTPDADSGGLTMTGTVMGTPAYMAPEQTRGMAVDHRADIYSLGVMLYEMLCGEIPRGVFDPPSHKVQVDVRLDEVVLKAMHSEPERRYQNTVEMKTDVDRIRTTPPKMGKGKKPAGGPPEGSTPTPQRHRTVAIAAAVLALIALLGVAGWFVFAEKEQRVADAGPVAPDWSGAVDLLALFDPKDSVAGSWSLQNGRLLVSDQIPHARAELPYIPPEEYDYRMVFSYRDTKLPSGETAQFLSKGGHSFRWVMGANGGKSLGFETIAGKTAADGANPTAKSRPPVLTPTATHTSLVEVRNDGIKAWLDGELVAEWKTDFKDVGASTTWALRNPHVLGVGSYQTALMIEKLQVREVTGKGTITRPLLTTATSTPASATKAAPLFTPAAATKDAPFENSLGMKFVPVPINGGPTGGQRVLFSVWETREQDFLIYAKEQKLNWTRPDFAREPAVPAVFVSWEWARDFCAWLTARERTAGKLSANEAYRLPSDHEWSCAVGIGDREDPAMTPEEKDCKILDVYAWGTAWPAPEHTVNYLGREADEEVKAGRIPGMKNVMGQHLDRHILLAPVGSYPANTLGLHDLAGNVSELVQDWWNATQSSHVTRGGNWSLVFQKDCPASNRGENKGGSRDVNFGFRVVLAPVGAAATQSSPALQRVEPPATAGRPDGLKPSTTLPAAAPAPIRIWDAPEKLPANVPGLSWQDGVVTMEKQTRAVARETGTGQATMHNGIVRFSLRMNRDADWTSVYIRDSGIPTAPHAYKLMIQAGSGKVEFIGEHGTPNRVLARWKLPRTYPEDEWVRVELRAVGNDFTVSLDGQPLGTVHDDEPSRPGFLGFSAWGKGYFRELEYVPLDATPATATKENPFVNQAGMQFVPVPITGGPTDGKRVLFSVWETRVQDYYEVFTKEKKRAWPKPDFEQGPTHPAVNVSWEDATAFCAWLTERHRKGGRLGPADVYRLPTDHEWSCAVGIGDREDAAKKPDEKDGKIADVYPWDGGWLPPDNAGNYWSEELGPLLAQRKFNWMQGGLPGRRDGFAVTSPAGSFPANRFGLHDLGGNLWEWCEDWTNDKQVHRVLRGASWNSAVRRDLLAAKRHGSRPGDHRGYDDYGFRVVLVPAAASAAGPSAGAAPVGEKWEEARRDENFSKGSSMLRVTAGGWVVQNQGRRFLATGPRRDGAVRIRTLFQEKDNLLIVVRSNDAVAAQDRYESCVLSSGDEVSLNRWASGKLAKALNGKDALAKRKLPVPLKPGEEYELEVRVVGDLFTVKLQGNVLIEARDATLAEGFFGIAFAATGVEVPVSSIEYLDLGGSALAVQTPQPGSEVRTFGGHRYQLLVEARKLTWDEAKAKAEVMGGHLATFTTEAEEDFVRDQLLIPSGKQDQQFWIGGQVAEGSRDYRWITDEPFTRFFWRPGQPTWRDDDAKGSGKPSFAAALFVTYGSPLDKRCGALMPYYKGHGFIVEWDDEGKGTPATGAPAGQPGAQSSPALQRVEPSATSGRPDGLKPSTTLPAAATIASATKDAPFVNSLGMQFVPVPITGGPTGGQRVLFSVWETRVQDYDVFVKERNHARRKTTFAQTGLHPVVSVTCEDATGFCAWLTERERKEGKIGAGEAYRLPSDHEWSCAVGIGAREDATKSPSKKDRGIKDVYPWGQQWPPPQGSGNFIGEESVQSPVGTSQPIAGYRDDFVRTAPVGSFAPNSLGLFDLGGNAGEWCDDWFDPAATERLRVYRGEHSGWREHDLLSSKRGVLGPTFKAKLSDGTGFRVVLAPMVP